MISDVSDFRYVNFFFNIEVETALRLRSSGSKDFTFEDSPVTKTTAD